jgi:hypothetical protein
VWPKPLDLAFLLDRLDHLTAAPIIRAPAREEAMAHAMPASLPDLQAATR